jgi:hypothetical protein
MTAVFGDFGGSGESLRLFISPTFVASVMVLSAGLISSAMTINSLVAPLYRMYYLEDVTEGTQGLQMAGVQQ